MDTLKGKAIPVTGASKGIGAAITRALGREGASVIAQYGSDPAGAREAIAGFAEGQAIAVGSDLSDMAAVDDCGKRALNWRGRIDVVVNTPR